MVNERNVIEGLSILTTIDKSDLQKLTNLGECVIIDSIVDGLQEGLDTIDVDIGIGTLWVHYLGDAIKYKFTPNAKFEVDVGNACIHKINLLDRKIESTLKDRIANTYKDLL